MADDLEQTMQDDMGKQGVSADADRATAAEPAVSALRDGIPDAEWDYGDSDECWQCGGEGFVYGCSWDWQCNTWDGDSCLCSKRCFVCNPPAQAIEARQGEDPAGLRAQHESAVHQDAPEPENDHDPS